MHLRPRTLQLAVCILVLMGALSSPAFSAKKKKPAAKKPSVVVPATSAKNQIEFVSSIGTEMNSIVLSPIDLKFNRDIRPELLALRDNLTDEAKVHPVASQDTYKTAVRLTNAWLSALNERETRRASLGLTPPPTRDMDHSTKTTLRFPNDVLYFKREINNAKAKKAKDKQMQAFFKDADKNNWRLRTEALRPNLESLYSQFRELRRQSLPVPETAR